jgi:predicted ATPase
MALYDSEQDRPQVASVQNDPGVLLLAVLAWDLWYLGYPDEALRRSRESLALAREVAHPSTLAFARVWTQDLHQSVGAHQIARNQMDALLALATEQGFEFYAAVGSFWRGLERVEQGQGEEAIAQVQRDLAAVKAAGHLLAWLRWLPQLAETYGKAGQPSQGLDILTEASTATEKSGAQVDETEIHRLRGELLLRLAVPDEQQAEESFHRALEVARLQRAKSLELRAAMSLSRLWQQQGKRDEARDLLAEIYGWFTEGFNTADLQAAKALLEELEA